MWKCEVVDGTELDVEEVAALYRASTLAERRPVEDGARFAGMVRGANLVITARAAGQLIGIARSLTDGVYATYLSDLAVDQAFQRQGVGRALIQATRDAAPQASLVLLAAPAAVGYYPRIGFTQHNSAWVMERAAG
ncbi:GNAT family N-acetyltransferase [Kitasatospora sp. GAS204B]|uniref:GNAT family N-acetyltransferase n=1 Tax=unclassified Kitasatospora TaxID=2633591 RepID=UPI0024743609|nr:GNAT family N-acetyltransferase [Kitasatospora sp. GAS204B]MDH6120176.1 putative N-acetyltransferase YhbS [Kitasatospora sp. GAS204B]